MKITRKGFHRLLNPAGALVSQHTDSDEAYEKASSLPAGVYTLQKAPVEIVIEVTGAPSEPPPVEPPPPPPPPPPLPEGVLEVFGRHDIRFPYPAEPLADRIDRAKAAAAPIKPWRVFRPGEGQVIAHSLNGQPHVGIKSLSIYSHASGLYEPTYADIDGTAFQVYPPTTSDPMLNIIPGMKTGNLRGGPRGRAILTPYWVMRGHSRKRRDGTLNLSPHLPMWVCLDMLGQVWYLFRDGSSQIVGKAPITTYANDFSFWDFVADDVEMRGVFWVVDTGTGTVIRGERAGDQFAWMDWATVPGKATSVRALGRKLYVCDGVSAVWEIDALDQAMPARKVVTLVAPFWVDYLSTGALVVMTTTGQLRYIDPVSGADVRSAIQLSGDPRWVALDVNRTGSCGPVDRILACTSHGAANVEWWLIEPDGTVKVRGLSPGGGVNSVGNQQFCREPLHYPWWVGFHPNDAVVTLQGGSDVWPTTLALIGAGDSSWATEPTYDHAASGRGAQVLDWGGSVMNAQPSLRSVINHVGHSLLGCSADHLAELPLAEFAASMRAGGPAGTIPRTITAADLKALALHVLGMSQRQLEDGVARRAEILAFNWQ